MRIRTPSLSLAGIALVWYSKLSGIVRQERAEVDVDLNASPKAPFPPFET